jgi:hypothetical protein
MRFSLQKVTAGTSVLVGLVLFQNCSAPGSPNPSDGQVKTSSSAVPPVLVPPAPEKSVTTIDLAKYFPKTVLQKKYRNSIGTAYSTYTYSPNPSAFMGLYDQFFNLQRKGFLGVWTKHYAGSQAPATYAQIYFGSDGSVTEVGDWYNLGPTYNNEFILFGYRNPSNLAVDGLRWSHTGGQINLSNVVHPYSQGRAGQAFTFNDSNKAVLAYTYVQAEPLTSFRPEYGAKEGVWAKGNGKVYSDVLRLRFYHGTNQGNLTVNCSSTAGNYLKGYYSKVTGFNTYVSEYYLAPGQWIIQERTLYIEDASYWRERGQNIPDCSGGAFNPSPDGSYGATYVE